MREEEMVNSIEIMFANIESMKKFQEKANEKKQVDFHDTIIELFSFGEYTLIQYYKGNWVEYNVCRNYDRETKTWDAGNYTCTLESALAICLDKMQSKYVKSNYQLNVERNFDISYDRMSELATQFKDGLIEDDEEQAMIYFDETCEMTDKEKEYFGIEMESEE